MKSTLTWNDVADLYGKKTGLTARILPIEKVYKWATKQPEITVNPDTSLSWRTDESK
jgi:hypothetical protein